MSGVKLASLALPADLGGELMVLAHRSAEGFRTSCTHYLRALGLKFDVTVDFDIRYDPHAAPSEAVIVDIYAPRLI